MNDNQDQNEEKLRERLAAARLDMSPEEKKEEWRGRENYLSERKKEAAMAMISGEQKTRLEEEARAREELLQKQKKIEELELVKKRREEAQKKILAEEQSKKDEAAEEKRLKQIENIIESKAEIKGLVKEKTGGLKAIKTLKHDIAETVKNDQITASKIIIQERAMRQEFDRQKKSTQRKKRTGVILTISLFFVIAGLVAVVFVWWYRKNEGLKEITPTKTSLIFSDEQLKIDTTNLTKETLKLVQKETFEKLRASSNSKNVIDLYFVKKIDEIVKKEKISKEVTLEASEYLATSTEVSGDFYRFVSKDFMVGVIRNQDISPFFIFKTDNYKHVADAMIVSGKSIISNLFSLFWSEDQNNSARRAIFHDLTLKNYDLRVLKDEEDKTVAGYVFLDNKTILFFESEKDFQKLLEIFQTSQ